MVTKVSKGWHHAFIIDSEFGGVDVYEIYKTTMGGYSRTSKPVLHVSGWDVDDAIRGLERMIQDLKNNRVFESTKKMDSYYEISND